MLLWSPACRERTYVLCVSCSSSPFCSFVQIALDFKIIRCNLRMTNVYLTVALADGGIHSENTKCKEDACLRVCLFR